MHREVAKNHVRPREEVLDASAEIHAELRVGRPIIAFAEAVFVVADAAAGIRVPFSLLPVVDNAAGQMPGTDLPVETVTNDVEESPPKLRFQGDTRRQVALAADRHK